VSQAAGTCKTKGELCPLPYRQEAQLTSRPPSGLAGMIDTILEALHPERPLERCESIGIATHDLPCEPVSA